MALLYDHPDPETVVILLASSPWSKIALERVGH